MRLARAKFCIVPVKKAYGKKKPLIQNTMGVPFSYQSLRNLMRALQS